MKSVHTLLAMLERIELGSGFWIEESMILGGQALPKENLARNENGNEKNYFGSFGLRDVYCIYSTSRGAGSGTGHRKSDGAAYEGCARRAEI